MDVEVLSESHLNVISFVRVVPRGDLDNDVYTWQYLPSAMQV